MIWFTKTKKKAVRNILDSAFVHLITFFRLQHHNLRTVIVCCSVPKMWFQQPWRQPVLQLEQQSPSSADQICNSSPSWICRTEPGSNFSQWNGVERTNLRQDSDWRRCFHNQHKNIWRLRFALVQIFFSKSTVFQMGSQPRQTWIDYFSNVGGLLGLVLGMGIVSFIELIWLCLRVGAKELNLTRWIR